MAKVDNRWEFSAPKFVDFTKLQQEDQASTADEWFETRRESEGTMEYEAPTTSGRSTVAPKYAKGDEDGLVKQPVIKYGLTTPKEFNLSTAKRKQRGEPNLTSPAPALQFASFAATPMSARASMTPGSARKSTAPGSVIASAYYPLRSTKPLTEPKEFSFASEKRVRQRPAEPSSTVVPPPPKFARTNVNSSTAATPRIPRVAMLAAKPVAKTTAPKLSVVVAKSPVRQRGLTQPRSPKLHSAKRSALKPPVPAAAPANSAPVARFKAAPAPKAVLNSRAGQMGIKMITKRSETVAQGLNFSTDRRPKARMPAPTVTKTAVKEVNVAPVRARVPETPRVATRPVSPRLSTRKRAETKQSMSVVAPAATPKAMSTFRARPMPDFGKSPAIGSAMKSIGKRQSEHISIVPTDSAKKVRLTKPVPFKLHDNNRANAAAEKEKAKVSKEIAKEAARFSHFVTAETAHILPLHDHNNKINNPAKKEATKMPKTFEVFVATPTPAPIAPMSITKSVPEPMEITPMDQPAVAAFDFSTDAYDVEAGVPMSDYAPAIGAGLRAL